MNEILAWGKEHALLIFAIAIILFNFAWLLLCRKQLNLKWYVALAIAILHDIVGYTAMRLLAIIEVGGDISKAANMRLFGAVYLLPLLYYLVAKLLKKKNAVVMDVAAICLTIGLVFGRLDCLVGGCCKGVIFFGLSPIRWPLREIELVFYVFFLIHYGRKILNEQTHGEVYPVFMIQYGALRFILEWFREEYTTSFGIFHLAHIWCVISFAIGLSIYVELQAKAKKVRR